MEIGFLGLGRMGRAIAANLVRAGHRLRVWNRSPAPVRELVDLGATAAERPADAARAEVLMTMLGGDEADRAVMLEQGVLQGAAPGLIHVNLATISVDLARELARLEHDRGITYIAAPVFGRPEAARAAKLNVVVAGAPEAIARIEALLSVIGQRVWRVAGSPERANVVKLAGNFMIASALQAMGEATALVRAYGMSSAEFLDILTGSLFAAPIYQTYGRLIAEERYEPAAFTMALGLKDVRLALRAAATAEVPMPFASVVHDQMLEALATGKAHQDWAALADIAARHAGLPRAK
ncbi:MAG TPA: NAD(P)-dependent oxidoreductase [Steroidobacteraceae bacterium]|nr:NAD(P)-dependent oxidoreductase [Steroidobacteraceae bacterium]